MGYKFRSKERSAPLSRITVRRPFADIESDFFAGNSGLKLDSMELGKTSEISGKRGKIFRRAIYRGY